MAARSTRVTIHNETSQTLTHLSDSLDHGEWTDPLTPPATIPPGAVVWWQSESDGVATGTEGRAAYRIGTDPQGGGQFDIHWDNPYAGTNFYEQGISGPYGFYFEGGKGNNAEAIYHLIGDGRIAVPGYLPSIYGYHFPNKWPAEHITSITLPDPFGDILIGNASWGLCGGMSFASRDYFEARRPSPVQSVNPGGEGDPLFDYIVQRLGQSLNVGDAADFVKYADPLYPNTDDITGDGRDWVMAHTSWPGIRTIIDSGHPCPIGIVIGHLPDVTHMGHQVCVYAYQLRGQQLTLWVYDPNTPGGDDVTMSLDISRTDQQLIPVASTINVGGSINCFFTQSYEQRTPPITLTTHSESSLGAVARDPDQLDLFWVGPDGAIGSTFYNAAPGQSWGDHQPFAITPPGWAVPGGRVTSAGRTAQHLDVFCVGPDGAIASTWWDAAAGQSWADHQPFAITPPGAARAGSPVVAINRSPDHLDVFWIGPDGAIASTWWDAAPNCNWGDHQPFPITPPGAAGDRSGLTAVSRAADQLDVFWVGANGAVGSTWWNAAAGQNWGDHQPFPVSPPGAARADSALAAVGRTGTHLDVFWIGPDGAIASTWWDAAAGQNWSDHQPFPISPPGATQAGSPLAAVGRTANHLDVFWVGADGSIGTTWYDSAQGMGWADHQPFTIAGPGSAEPASHLAAVARTPEHLDVFWIGGDHAIGSTWYDSADGSHWGDHQPFAVTPPRAAIGPGSPIGTPSGFAVARDPDQLDVFWTDPDASVASTWWNAAPGQGWGDHEPFGVAGRGAAVAGGRVAAVGRTPNHLDVFWVGADGAIASNWFDLAPGCGWGDHNAFPITPSGAARADSPVAAVGRTPNHLDVFWIAPDGAIASTWWDSAPGCGWGDHQPFTVTPAGAARPGSDLTAVSRDPRQLDLFWIGGDGAIGSTWWNAAAGQSWGDHQPFPVTPPGAAGPGSGLTSVGRTPNHVDVFWIGPDFAVGSTWWDAAPGCNWSDHQPFPITGPGAARAGSPLSAVGRTHDHLDVFWIGPDSAVESTWWDVAPGCNWSDHQPFPISGPGAARAGSPLAAVARTADHLDVFWAGPRDAVDSNWWDAAPGCGWGDHSPFTAAGPPPIVPWPIGPHRRDGSPSG
ncbi:PLL family lectin [Microlunatus ginsengisoli]